MGASTKKIKIMPLLCNGKKLACEGFDASWSVSCGAFKLEIRDRLEARPTKVILIFDTQFKCTTAYLTRYFIHLAPLIVHKAVRGGRDAPQEHLTFVEQAEKPVKRDLCVISERQIFLRFAIETLNYNKK